MKSTLCKTGEGLWLKLQKAVANLCTQGMGRGCGSVVAQLLFMQKVEFLIFSSLKKYQIEGDVKDLNLRFWRAAARVDTTDFLDQRG